MSDDAYDVMDEFRSEKGDRLRSWARAYGCLLVTLDEHQTLCDQLHLAIAAINKEADPIGAAEIIERLVSELEDGWYMHLH